MSEPASIVIIEDDADINEVVAVHLRRNGFACTQAFSGSEGRLLLSGSEPFDLVITDLMLPGMELLARVQVQLRHADVRRASASGAPSDERLPEPAAATAMRYKDWTLDVDARTLSVREEPVRLTRLEFNILEALVRRPRKVFTKRELFEIAWNEESAVEEKAINVHVSNIRSKLRAAHSAGEIETVWGIGFKLAE